ncbi:Stomatin-2 [Toxocara canis]|uniref:Stomatin-2 n=1 Tax=Toxocara canis TaxID=6265 RepID=A0A0B2V582_TOXCA|nr:Stomatin-2 [Toxocara canis]
MAIITLRISDHPDYRGPRPPRIVVERAGTSVDSDSDAMDDEERRPPTVRMGRRFTLNPLIFAKEEQEARRQSLAQLKLSYYPRNAHRKCFFFSSFTLLLFR